MVYLQRQSSVRQFEQTATALASAVQGSLEQAMMLGETQHVQEAVMRVGEEPMVSVVAVYSPDGMIAAANDTTTVGSSPQTDGLENALREGQSSVLMRRRDGRRELRISTPIFNRSECESCHSPPGGVLGAILVDLDTSMLDEQTRQGTVFIAIVGGLAFVVIGGGVAFGLRRMVLNPLSSLTRSAQKLSAGDYSARAAATTENEIGLLAGTFNDMAASIEQRTMDLEASRQELAKWNQDLEEMAQRRTLELMALNAIITTINESHNLDRILNDALGTIMALMGTEAGTVHLLDEDTDRLTLAAQRGLEHDQLRKAARLRPNEGPTGQVMQAGKPVVVGSDSDDRLAWGSPDLHSSIAVPVQSKSRVLGALSLASRESAAFSPETVRLLGAMGEAMGIAVENARAAQDLEDASRIREQLLEKLISAQEEERRRIARELHDDASQSLAALAITLDDVAGALPVTSHDAGQQLMLLKQQAVQTLSRIRDLALELRPSALDDLGLTMAIDWYAKDYLSKHGLDVRIEVEGPQVKLPSHTETMLFRIVQEALTNTVKHGQATRASVRLEDAEDTIAGEIDDDGRGFDVQSVMRGGGMRRSLGIHGMTERAALLGGSLIVQSQRGKGTHLRVEVPRREENASNGPDQSTAG
jgi:signal transduction histidine kinase